MTCDGLSSCWTTPWFLARDTTYSLCCGARTRGRAVPQTLIVPRLRAGGRFSHMTHTVCQPCYDCKYTDCVAVCPVECFYQDEMMLYIDPQDCIDCEACVPECPVEAIFAEANVPAQWASFTPLNAEKSAALKASDDGHITEKQDAKEGPECKKK